MNTDLVHGVWSATPTPFTEKMELDIPSLGRLVEHHLRLGVKGLFLAGTCGEGSCLSAGQRECLLSNISERAAGRLAICMQVTGSDLSETLDNAGAVADGGADMAVIGTPDFLEGASAEKILDAYRHIIDSSPLPVGIYYKGRHSRTAVPHDCLRELYADERVLAVKDSSSDPAHMEMALEVKKRRPSLRLFNGDEFNCVPYIRAGYDGLLLGGAIFNGYMARLIIEAVQAGNLAGADELQLRMNEMMYAVYGGRKIACWLSGLKKLLVDMGIFTTWKNFADYPLTEDCIAAIDDVLRGESGMLLPGEA